MAKRVTLSEKPKDLLITNIEDLGKIVEYRRTQLGMSREELCGYCDINYRTLQKIEKGEGNLKVDNLFKVLNNLGITLKAEDSL